MRKNSRNPFEAELANSKRKEKAANAKPQSILEAFEHIVELSEDSSLDEEFFEKASLHISLAARRLKLSKMQTVLLAQFVDRSDDNHIGLHEIANHVGCRPTRFLRLTNDIDALEEKRYIRASRGNRNTTYRMDRNALKAIVAGKPYVYIREQAADTRTFFDLFGKLVSEHEDDELPYDKLASETMLMLEDIKHTPFARKLRGFTLSEANTLLFLYMAHLFIENNDDRINFRDISQLYDEGTPSWVKYEFRDRTSLLFTHKLIENPNVDGMADPEQFKLTNFAKDDVLAELNLHRDTKVPAGLIKSDSFAKKKLFYNKEEEAQIKELSSILSPTRFKEVQERLEKIGMRKGFCCLFYGAPGTGKTETVQQLARITGRDIMRVDVDKIKSCWVGESEQNIKALFDRYRTACQNSELAPILLFNEADAVLGVRMEGASRAVDKMENSIQNIILQEMETLEGIMIATTNLTSNLDQAFERRFLYKIRYQRPTVEARAHIWRAMLPALKPKQAKTLGSQFDLSGGEIENIARKHSVNAILSGKEEIDLDEIITSCRQERISTSSRPRIGFSEDATRRA